MATLVATLFATLLAVAVVLLQVERWCRRDLEAVRDAAKADADGYRRERNAAQAALADASAQRDDMATALAAATEATKAAQAKAAWWQSRAESVTAELGRVRVACGELSRGGER